MNSADTVSSACDINLYYIGWKYYNSIKKKAMEQEFSWSGLVLSLSIAFFIVISSAFILSCIYNSFSLEKNYSQNIKNKLYRIETVENSQNKNNTADYLNIELLNSRQIKSANQFNLV